MGSIKKFLTNKNTVTILGVLIGVVALYIGYNYRVSQAVTLMSVPVAKININPRTEITADAITYVKVPRSTIDGFKNIITDPNQIRGKMVSYNASIPQNSFFFSSSIMSKQDMPDSANTDIPDGYTIFSLPVNLESTYYNSIYPGNYIDLYVAGRNDLTNKILYGKFIEKIEVLAVKDNKGQHVFESTIEERIPANLMFAVPDDLHQLLEKAKRVSGITIIPIIRNASYQDEPGDVKISSQYLKDWILLKTDIIPN